MIKLTYEKFILFLLVFVGIEMGLLFLLHLPLTPLIFTYFLLEVLLFVSVGLHKQKRILNFMVVFIFNLLFLWFFQLDIELIIIPLVMLSIPTVIDTNLDRKIDEKYIIIGDSPLIQKIKADLRSFQKKFKVIDSIEEIKSVDTTNTIVIYSEKNIDLLLKGIDFELRDLISDVDFYEKYLLKIPLLYYHDEYLEFKAINHIKAELKNNFLFLGLIRIFDIFAAMLLLIVFLPVMVIIAVLIKVVDKQDEIFFKQIRYGIHKNKFEIYKFKTMVEATNEAKVTTQNDSRVTKLGLWIRKYHLDELPQIFNILKGDISLVGPRPINYKLEDELSKKIKYYDLKYLVKPGITGDSQILSMDTRNFNGQVMRTEYDWYLIKNHNIANIFYILVKTVQAFFTGHGSR
jgi:lipopolysaccharide/colanic/teichoic acid biosynthesis glycosyltransferase